MPPWYARADRVELAAHQIPRAHRHLVHERESGGRRLHRDSLVLSRPTVNRGLGTIGPYLAGGMQRCVRRHLHRRLVNGTPTAKASAASGRCLDRIGHQTEPTQPDVVYVARANETGEARWSYSVELYSTCGNQAKQLATPIAQKWLTKEFAAGAKTGDRPDAHTTNPRS